MYESFFSQNFWVGIVSGFLSGLMVSLFFWSIRRFSRTNGILIPTDFHDNHERIRVTNMGRYRIDGFDVFGQLSYLEGGNRKRYNVKFDGSVNCYSPNVILPNHSRTFRIDLTDCIPDNEINTFHQFKNLFPDGKLIVHVRYHGKFTDTVKRVDREFYQIGD